MTVNVGTAGWTIARDVAEQFSNEGSSLERYASRFPVTEINSSFHRPHRLTTWQRWRDSVPEAFRFSVKLSKVITHQAKLVHYQDPLSDFFAQIDLLGPKLAVVLVQLPPKLELLPEIAEQFFSDLRLRTPAHIACEPRHISWFGPQADDLFERFRIARVAADPALCEAAARPGGWRGFEYWRLHGSPVMYRSSYIAQIDSLAARMKHPPGTETWCIFDNTASSAATADALALMRAFGIDQRMNAGGAGI